MILRTENDPRAILQTARRIVEQLNPDQPVSQARTLGEILSEDLHNRDRWLAILFGAFSSIALFLAAIGLYSVASFAVTQRTREIGLRVALGATRGTILRSVLLSAVGSSIVRSCRWNSLEPCLRKIHPKFHKHARAESVASTCKLRSDDDRERTSQLRCLHAALRVLSRCKPCARNRWRSGNLRFC